MTKKDIQDDALIVADVLLRLTTLEKMLISKGIFTQEEFHKEMGIVASRLAKEILQKVKEPEEIEELMKSFFKPTDKADKN